MAVRVKRVYEPSARADGTRVLVDRLWPRGLRKEQAGVDLWLKEVAPSHELRRWFGHDPGKWAEFRRRYREELRGADQTGALARLRGLARGGTVTLLFGAKDEAHNNAVVLAEVLSGRKPA